MNITQFKRSLQPVALYQCANSQCVRLVPSSDLFWAGGADVLLYPWGWYCADHVELAFAERDQTLSAFMAEELVPEGSSDA